MKICNNAKIAAISGITGLALTIGGCFYELPYFNALQNNPTWQELRGANGRKAVLNKRMEHFYDSTKPYMSLEELSSLKKEKDQMQSKIDSLEHNPAFAKAEALLVKEHKGDLPVLAGMLGIVYSLAYLYAICKIEDEIAISKEW
jgi:hypothetical protein